MTVGTDSGVVNDGGWVAMTVGTDSGVVNDGG